MEGNLEKHFLRFLSIILINLIFCNAYNALIITFMKNYSVNP